MHGANVQVTAAQSRHREARNAEQDAPRRTRAARTVTSEWEAPRTVASLNLVLVALTEELADRKAVAPLVAAEVGPAVVEAVERAADLVVLVVWEDSAAWGDSAAWADLVEWEDASAVAW